MLQLSGPSQPGAAATAAATALTADGVTGVLPPVVLVGDSCSVAKADLTGMAGTAAARKRARSCGKTADLEDQDTFFVYSSSVSLGTALRLAGSPSPLPLRRRRTSSPAKRATQMARCNTMPAKLPMQCHHKFLAISLLPGGTMQTKADTTTSQP